MFVFQKILAFICQHSAHTSGCYGCWSWARWRGWFEDPTHSVLWNRFLEINFNRPFQPFCVPLSWVQTSLKLYLQGCMYLCNYLACWTSILFWRRLRFWGKRTWGNIWRTTLVAVIGWKGSAPHPVFLKCDRHVIKNDSSLGPYVINLWPRPSTPLFWIECQCPLTSSTSRSFPISPWKSSICLWLLSTWARQPRTDVGNVWNSLPVGVQQKILFCLIV